MHIADPAPRHPRRQRDRRRRPADRGRRRRLSRKLRGQGRVAVAFFGDGAVAQGAFHEARQPRRGLAAAGVLFCENNGYAEFSDSRTMTRMPGVAERARPATGSSPCAVDGNDVVAVHAADARRGRRAAAPARARPVEAETYRWHGHYEGDPQRYRPTTSRPPGASATRSWSPRRARSRRRRRRRRASCERDAASEARASASSAPIERARDAPRSRRSRRPTRDVFGRLSAAEPPGRPATSTPSTRAWPTAIEEDERVVLSASTSAPAAASSASPAACTTASAPSA